MGGKLSFFTDEGARYLWFLGERDLPLGEPEIRLSPAKEKFAVWWESVARPALTRLLEDAFFSNHPGEKTRLENLLKEAEMGLRMWDARNPGEPADRLASRAGEALARLTELARGVRDSKAINAAASEAKRELTGRTAIIVELLAVEVEAVASGHPETTRAKWELFRRYGSEAGSFSRKPGEPLGAMWRRGIDRIRDHGKLDHTILNANVAMIDALSRFDQANFEQASDVDAARMLWELGHAVDAFHTELNARFSNRAEEWVTISRPVREVTAATFSEVLRASTAWRAGETPRPSPAGPPMIGGVPNVKPRPKVPKAPQPAAPHPAAPHPGGPQPAAPHPAVPLPGALHPAAPLPGVLHPAAPLPGAPHPAAPPPGAPRPRGPKPNR